MKNLFAWIRINFNLNKKNNRWLCDLAKDNFSWITVWSFKERLTMILHFPTCSQRYIHLASRLLTAMTILFPWLPFKAFSLFPGSESNNTRWEIWLWSVEVLPGLVRCRFGLGLNKSTIGSTERSALRTYTLHTHTHTHSHSIERHPYAGHFKAVWKACTLE